MCAYAFGALTAQALEIFGRDLTFVSSSKDIFGQRAATLVYLFLFSEIKKKTCSASQVVGQISGRTMQSSFLNVRACLSGTQRGEYDELVRRFTLYTTIIR